MRQLSLLDNDLPALAGVMPAIRAAMRRIAGDPEGEGRKLLADKLSAIARHEEIPLTGGSAKGISLDTLNKWLSPSDASHPPSVNAILAFCRASGEVEPVRIMLRAIAPDLDVMTAEDRHYRDLGKAEADLKAARKRKKLLEEGL